MQAWGLAPPGRMTLARCKHYYVETGRGTMKDRQGNTITWVRYTCEWCGDTYTKEE
jgi:transposase-like protein